MLQSNSSDLSQQSTTPLQYFVLFRQDVPLPHWKCVFKSHSKTSIICIKNIEQIDDLPQSISSNIFLQSTNPSQRFSNGMHIVSQLKVFPGHFKRLFTGRHWYTLDNRSKFLQYSVLMAHNPPQPTNLQDLVSKFIYLSGFHPPVGSVWSFICTHLGLWVSPSLMHVSRSVQLTQYSLIVSLTT